MKKIIFHCGSAKTGSTALQAILWANRKPLADNGVHYCPRFVRAGNIDPLNIAVRDVRQPSQRTQALAAGRARLDELFGSEGYHTIILSNESAIGDPFKDGRDGFFPLLDDALCGLKQMFEGYAVVPLFFVRNQATLIPSFYGQRVRQGASYSLTEFTDKACEVDISWQSVTAAIAKAFGGESLELHTFEGFVQNPTERTAQLFAKLLGIDVIAVEAPPLKNERASVRAIAVQRFINRCVDSMSFVDEAVRATTKKKIRRALFSSLETVFVGKKPKLPVDIAAKFSTQYAKDMQVLGL